MIGLIAGGIGLVAAGGVIGAVGTHMLEKGVSEALSKDEDDVDELEEYDEEEEE